MKKLSPSGQVSIVTQLPIYTKCDVDQNNVPDILFYAGHCFSWQNFISESYTRVGLNLHVVKNALNIFLIGVVFMS